MKKKKKTKSVVGTDSNSSKNPYRFVNDQLPPVGSMIMQHIDRALCVVVEVEEPCWITVMYVETNAFGVTVGEKETFHITANDRSFLEVIC